MLRESINSTESYRPNVSKPIGIRSEKCSAVRFDDN